VGCGIGVTGTFEDLMIFTLHGHEFNKKPRESFHLHCVAVPELGSEGSASKCSRDILVCLDVYR
jgi:hypothetical protein